MANGVALLMVAVGGRSAPDEEQPRQEHNAESPARVGTAGDGSTASAYRRELEAKGLTFEDTKLLVLEWLNARAANPDQERTHDYWRSDYALSSIETARVRVAAEDDVRARLVEVYGADARGDPAFDRAFRPLDRRYAFFDSAQQVALQKYQLERQLAQAKEKPLARPLPPSGQGSSVAAAQPEAYAALFAELSARVGADAATQYLYRFHPLGEQLRTADLKLSETEFQQAFQALFRFEAAPGDPAAFAQTRATLRATLGDVRATRLWAARDPFFAVVEKWGRQQALSDDTIFVAYEIFNANQDRLAEAASRFAGVDPARASSEMRALQADMEQRLLGLVGAAAAAAFLRVVAQFSFVLGQQPATD
jgi:hypothetical protein